MSCSRPHLIRTRPLRLLGALCTDNAISNLGGWKPSRLMQEPNEGEMTMKMFLVRLMGLGLVVFVGGTAIRAQEAATAPNYADTIAWIQQKISLHYRWSYLWTQNSQKTPWLHKAVFERDDFGPAAPCHLTLVHTTHLAG